MSEWLLRAAGLTRVGVIKGVTTYVAKDRDVRQYWFGDDTLAFVWGGVICYRSTYAMRQKSVRDHEMRHIEQRRALGPVLFEVGYMLMHILYGYDDNPFEVDARSAE